jgi:hypothetical protein
MEYEKIKFFVFFKFNSRHSGSLENIQLHKSKAQISNAKKLVIFTLISKFLVPYVVVKGFLSKLGKDMRILNNQLWCF